MPLLRFDAMCELHFNVDGESKLMEHTQSGFNSCRYCYSRP
jgi:hypothetical protein